MTRRTPTASRLFSLETLESRLLLTTYYVNAGSGADANPGTADAAAFKTLQKAANTVVAGDVVVVRPGTYAGFRRMNAPGGTAAAPIRFSADPGVVVNAFGPSETNALINIENTNAADDSYVIRGNTCYGNNWDGIHTNVSDGVNQVNSNGLIEANVVHDNMLAGMDLTGISNAVIRNNLAYGNGRHAVVLQNSNANPTVGCHDVT